MPLDPALRSLDLSLPACPAAVLRLGALMARDDVSVQDMAAVVETDMALAAAVMRAVNSAMFGILRRVETVAEAVLFLGLREVAALTCEAGLRASFPQSPAMSRLWDRARLRSVMMGRCGDALGLHAWRAQSAGLFAQVGQAALMAHDASRHAGLMAALPTPAWPDADVLPSELAAAERGQFGVDHAVLGSALCRAWGLAAPVADYVRDRPLVAVAWEGRPQDVKALLQLGAEVDRWIDGAQPQESASPGTEPPPQRLAWSEMPMARLQGEVSLQWRRMLNRTAAKADAEAA